VPGVTSTATGVAKSIHIKTLAAKNFFDFLDNFQALDNHGGFFLNSGNICLNKSFLNRPMLGISAAGPMSKNQRWPYRLLTNWPRHRKTGRMPTNPKCLFLAAKTRFFSRATLGHYSIGIPFAHSTFRKADTL
jgi:hypothetical protein